MIILLRKTSLYVLAILILAFCVAFGFFCFRSWIPVATFAPCQLSETTFVIDPGHGGEDGGAVSAAGQAESNLNLAISNRLDGLLNFYGVKTKMTRTEDVSIHSPECKSIREKKSSDLHNRVSMVEKVDGAVLISIHQNSYPNPKYGGMQVFYADMDSRPLAVGIQENVQKLLDAENKRQALKIPPTVYLMNHVSCRAVLAECGFLSNPKDARLLNEEGYQKKVAITIAAACLSER